MDQYVFGKDLPQQVLLLTQLYRYTSLTYAEYWVRHVWKARLLERKATVMEMALRAGGWINGAKRGTTHWERFAS